MITYEQHKQNCQDRMNKVPMFFAFSNEQFAENIKKVGLTMDDIDQICSIGAGGYMKKTDIHLLKDCIKANDDEKKAMKKDEKALKDAIVYELANHEYCITGDPSTVIDILDLDMKNQTTQRLFKAAIKIYNKQMEASGW